MVNTHQMEASVKEMVSAFYNQLTAEDMFSRQVSYYHLDFHLRLGDVLDWPYYNPLNDSFIISNVTNGDIVIS